MPRLSSEILLSVQLFSSISVFFLSKRRVCRGEPRIIHSNVETGTAFITNLCWERQKRLPSGKWAFAWGLQVFAWLSNPSTSPQRGDQPSSCHSSLAGQLQMLLEFLFSFIYGILKFTNAKQSILGSKRQELWCIADEFFTTGGLLRDGCRCSTQ